MITAAVVTTGIAADEHHLTDVLWQHHRLSGLDMREVVADAKYGTSFNFLYLGKLGIEAFIPLTRFGVMRKDIWGREHSDGCQRRTLTSVRPGRSSSATRVPRTPSA